MKDTEYIVAIYRDMSISSGPTSESAYYILYILDEKGLLDTSIALKLYREHFKSQLTHMNGVLDDWKSIGPFESSDRLNQFAFQLCEELNAEKVSLLSVQEYNILLEKGQTASAFYRDLIDQGNVMENIAHKKKNFLSRFFSH